MSVKYLSFRAVFVAILLLLGCNAAHAEGNCPEGYYPIGGDPSQGAPQGCAPIPGYNQGQQGGPQAPPVRWIESAGAIATDPNKGVLGTAVNASNPDAAAKAALADCQAKGGLACKLDITYENGCAAMVAGDTGYNTKAGATTAEAAQAAMKVCSAATKNCRVYYSACSLPSRVQ